MNNATKDILCEKCGAVTRRFYYGASGDVCWTDMMHKCPLLGRTHREGQEVDEMVARATDSGITLSREEAKAFVAKIKADMNRDVERTIDEGAEALGRAIEKEVQQGRTTVQYVCKTCKWQCTTRGFAAGCMCKNGCGEMVVFASFTVSAKLSEVPAMAGTFDKTMKNLFDFDSWEKSGRRASPIEGDDLVAEWVYDISLGDRSIKVPLGDRSIKVPLGTKIADITAGVNERGEGVYTINRSVEPKPAEKCKICNGRGCVDFPGAAGRVGYRAICSCVPLYERVNESEEASESHGPPLEAPEDDAKTIPKISIPAPSAPARQYTREDGSIDWERYTGRAR